MAIIASVENLELSRVACVVCSSCVGAHCADAVRYFVVGDVGLAPICAVDGHAILRHLLVCWRLFGLCKQSLEATKERTPSVLF